MRILVINPGSTSTKLAVFDGKRVLFERTVRSDPPAEPELDMRVRRSLVADWLREVGVTSLDAVVARGGILRPLPPGVYEVGSAMVEELIKGLHGWHASNLGAPLAQEFGRLFGCPAYVVDPVSVDEMIPEARLSGLKEVPRRSLFHALNIRAIIRDVCGELGRSPDDFNAVVAHLGGGTSVVAVRGGRVIDVNNANEEGPFSMERAGGVPAVGLLKWVFARGFDLESAVRRLVGGGGMMDYLGTRSLEEVESRMLKGDEKARLAWEALAYQVCKEIGAMTAALGGRPDAIILTGGMARSTRLTSRIRERIGFLGEVLVRPGEQEMRALADGAIEVLTGKTKPMRYPPPEGRTQS